MLELKPKLIVDSYGKPKSPVTSTRTAFEDNGDNLYTILRRINNHLPNDVVAGFPWVEGRLQDRSVALNQYSQFTPIVTDGKASLINGNRFTAPEDGDYVLFIQSLRGNSASSRFIQAWQNYNVPVTSPINSNVIFSKNTTSTWFPPVMISKRLKANDYWIVSVFTDSTALATICYDSLVPRFSFKRIG